MISEKQSKKYCNEDISLIENYDRAVQSSEKWECHHRLETEDGKTMEQLIDEDLYFNRPASELIFLPPELHWELHAEHFSEEHRAKISEALKGRQNTWWLGRRHSEESKRKMSEAVLGRRHSEETRRKISESHMGLKASDEARRKMSETRRGMESPFKGKRHSSESIEKMRKSHLGMRWFNDGTKCVRAKECPPGFKPGRLSFKKR